MKTPLPALLTSLLILAGTTAQADWTEEELNKILQYRLGEGKDGIGMVIGYWDGEQSIVVGHGMHSRDDARVPDGDTLFEIGSITKVFTTTLLADMVRSGEVKLGDPAQQYMPEDVELPEKYGQPITLFQLATHTAGLPRMPDDAEGEDWRNPYADYTPEEMYAFVEQVKLGRSQLILALPENGPTRFAFYSNLGMGLLGDALANGAGTSFEAAVTERVTRPLGMTDTVITMNEDQAARLAPGHNAGGFELPPLEMPTMQGAVALRSTANDLMVFLRANLAAADDSPLPALQDTHKAQVTTDSIAAGRVGLGWLIKTSQYRRIHWHNGTTRGYKSYIGFSRKTGEAVVILTNSVQDVSGLGFGLLDPSVRLARMLR